MNNKLVAILLYILATLLANYTAEWFIPLPVFGLVSVGTLFFGITFTQRDRIHQYGRRVVYQTIAFAAVLNTIAAVLLGVPWRIVLASFVAIVLAESADTEVYQRFIARPWLERVVRSNLVSVPIDTLLFNLIAFAGVFDPLTLLAICFGDIVVKLLVSVLAALWRSSPRRSKAMPA